MKKIYIIKYCGGSYEDYYTKDIFITDNKSNATKYVTKFNKLLKKWNKYYEQFEEGKFGMKWIKDEYVEQYYNRWSSLKDINNCYWQEIEVR